MHVCRKTCINLYMYVCMCACIIYMYIGKHAQVYICLYVSMYGGDMCDHVFMCACIYVGVCMYVCRQGCMSLYMDVSMNGWMDIGRIV